MNLLGALGVPSETNSPSTKPILLGSCGAAGALVAYLPGEMLYIVDAAVFPAQTVAHLIVFLSSLMAVYAIAYSIALTIGQNRYLHRPWLGLQEGLIAVVGGSCFGAVSGALAQAFFSVAVVAGQGNPLFTEVARIVAWAMFGSLIGLGMSFIIPNLGRVYGPLGGTLGGAVGAIGFIVCTMLAGDSLGRCIGLAILGFALGYAIGLVEESSRTAWLQVSRENSRETVRVSLGADLVCVGSNSQRCTIWVQGARSIALRFRFVEGKVICDDMVSERSAVVDPGFRQQVGNVTVTVCILGHSVPAASQTMSAGITRTTLPPPPPPPRGQQGTLHGNQLGNARVVSRSGSGSVGLQSSPQPTAKCQSPPLPPPPPPMRSLNR